MITVSSNVPNKEIVFLWVSLFSCFTCSHKIPPVLLIQTASGNLQWAIQASLKFLNTHRPSTEGGVSKLTEFNQILPQTCCSDPTAVRSNVSETANHEWSLIRTGLWIVKKLHRFRCVDKSDMLLITKAFKAKTFAACSLNTRSGRPGTVV